MSTILILRSRNSVKQPVPLFLSSGRQYSVKIVNNVYNFNYNFNFEISKQGLTACATLCSLLPNQTESSSLVSILLTATIARSTSLKVAALLNSFCSAQKFLVTIKLALLIL